MANIAVNQINNTNNLEYINIDLLIIEVEVRPVLYVKCLYKSLSEREISKNWCEVASNLNAKSSLILSSSLFIVHNILFVGKDCITTWNKLLKTFQEYYTSSKKTLESWLYYEQMQFILPYICRYVYIP